MFVKNQLIKYWSLFFLLLIFAFGLHLRLTSVLETEVINPIRADAKDYVLYAINLQQYSIYSRSIDGINKKAPIPDAARPPVYPLFLTLFIDDQNISKETLLNIQITQALLSSFIILLIYSIFSSFVGKIASLAIAFLIAISPHLININIYILSESLFGFFLISFFWLLSKLIQQKNIFYFSIFLGVVLAISSLTRPWLQYFIVFLIPLFFITLPKQNNTKFIICFSSSFIIVMGLWLLRNIYSIDNDSNGSVLISSVLHGMYPNQMYQGNPESYGFPYRFDPNKAEITRSLSTLLTEIINRFQNEPWEHIKWYLIGKPISLFSWSYIQGMGESFIYPVQASPYFTYTYFQWTNAFMKTIHSLLMILAVFASIIAWLPKIKDKYSEQSLFLRCTSLLIIYFVLIHVLVAPLPRYTVPIFPLIYGMAIFSLLQIFSGIKNKILTNQGYP